ncbi:MAG: AAA family ATPase [Clostridiales Family XIII bacterium]|nr:AAA family ATPase [Clostridiales Family XIII bacterium]
MENKEARLFEAIEKAAIDMYGKDKTMRIDNVEIKNFLVFKGCFSCDFCPGTNVIIGGNGTGKTTLLKVMYALCEHSSESAIGNSPVFLADYFLSSRGAKKRDFYRSIYESQGVGRVGSGEYAFYWFYEAENENPFFGMSFENRPISEDNNPHDNIFHNRRMMKAVYIPTMEMLSHSEGFLALCHERKMPFDETQIDILSKAELPEMHELPVAAGRIMEKISGIIEGTIVYEKDVFYVKKNNGKTIPFSLEASGYQKFGLLWKLLHNGLLDSGHILLWDEPEESINPELMPALVDILLELCRNGVQIFIATHSSNLAQLFDIKRANGDSLLFCNLSKNSDDTIRCDSAENYSDLRKSVLEEADEALYRAVVARAMGVEADDRRL